MFRILCDVSGATERQWCSVPGRMGLDDAEALVCVAGREACRGALEGSFC